MPGTSIHGPRCPRCGAPQSGGDTHGLCARCLLDAFLQPPSDEAASTPTPKGAFGEYELLEMVARGGMGMVYRARHRALNRVTALKLVDQGHLHQNQTRERFRLEAEAAAKLDHPNIVPVYEVGENDGQPFLAMKFSEAGSLADLLKAGRPTDSLGVEGVVRVVAKIARAIHHAHERGILHRDLKPANILMDTRAEPLVSDFGLARFLDRDASLTATGSVLGTPAYMSPEQTTAQAEAVTTATDVWGIGTILYELLAGHPPFQAASPPLLLRQIAEAAPPRFKPDLGVDRDLETICFRCLEKEPHRRYASALALAEDLERWLRGEPILARPIGWSETAAKWIRRNPALASLLGLFSISVLAFFTVLIVSQLQLRQASDRIRIQSEERRQQNVRLNVAAANRMARDVDLHNALLWQAEALRLDRDGGSRESVHRLRFQSLLDHIPQLSQLWLLPSAVNGAAVSADGTFVALGCSDGSLHFYQTIDGRPLGAATRTGSYISRVHIAQDQQHALAVHTSQRWGWHQIPGGQITAPQGLQSLSYLGHSEGVTSVALAVANGVQVFSTTDWKPIGSVLPITGKPQRAYFCRDHTQLLTTVDLRRFSLWQLSDSQKLAEFTLPEAALIARVSPDGALLLTIMPNEHLTAWDVRTGTRRWQASELALGNREFAVTKDGQRVIAWGTPGHSRVLNLATGQPLTTPFPAQSGVVSVNFSPDGKLITTAGFDGTAVIWNAETGWHASPAIQHGLFVLCAEFGPDSRVLVTGCADGTARLWRFRPPNERGLALRHGEPVDQGEWSSDGTLLLTRGKLRVQVWDGQSGTPTSPALVHPAPLGSATFTPDARQVLTAGSDQVLRFWDVRSGQETGSRLMEPAPLSKAVFDRSGEQLVAVGRDQSAHLWRRQAAADMNGSFWRSGPTVTHRKNILHAEFDPSGRRLLTAGEDGVVQLWDTASGEPITSPFKHIGRVAAAHFSPDGRQVIAGSFDSTINARGVTIWDIAAEKAIRGPLLLRDGIVSIALSPKMDRIAAIGEDNLGYIWDWSTGRQVGAPLQHASSNSKISYSPDALLIGTASYDTSAQVWEAITGEAATQPIWHGSAATWIGFDPRSTRVATTSRDGTARILELHRCQLPFEDLVQVAELLAAHQLGADGTRTPLNHAGLKARWDYLREKYPALFP